MGFFRHVVALACTVFAAALVAQANGARSTRPDTTWTVYGDGADSSQYSALDEITRSNVSQPVRRADVERQIIPPCVSACSH